MTTPTRPEKIYFAVIFLAAIYVGVAGFLFPTYLAEVFTWMTLPPLHARFLGSLYLYGALFMLLSLLAVRWTQVATALIAAAIWTGMMFVTSLLNLSAFDFSQPPTWAWFLSYSIYPILALLLAWNRSRRTPELSNPTGSTDSSAPSWARTFLVAQGIFVIVLSLALLLVPDFMASIWPWKMTAGLAQFYSGPLIAYGFSSIQFARAGTRADLRVLLPAMLLFTALSMVASLLHIGLFSAGNISTWLWFAILIILAAFQAAIIFHSFKLAASKLTVPSTTL